MASTYMKPWVQNSQHYKRKERTVNLTDLTHTHIKKKSKKQKNSIISLKFIKGILKLCRSRLSESVLHKDVQLQILHSVQIYPAQNNLQALFFFNKQ